MQGSGIHYEDRSLHNIYNYSRGQCPYRFALEVKRRRVTINLKPAGKKTVLRCMQSCKLRILFACDSRSRGDRSAAH